MNNAAASQYCDLYVNKEAINCLGIELAQHLLVPFASDFCNDSLWRGKLDDVMLKTACFLEKKWYFSISQCRNRALHLSVP